MTTITNLNSNSFVTDAQIKQWFADNSINITGKSIFIQRNTNGVLLKVIVDVTVTDAQKNKFKSNLFNYRNKAHKGEDIPSAESITLSVGNSFTITGSTSVKYINTNNWDIGSIVILEFRNGITLHHNASPSSGYAGLFLKNSSNYTAPANSTITLWYNGTHWKESNMGDTGATGAKGDDGADGATGAKGDDGADGSKGDDGADGATGSQGADGTDGAAGTDGSTGAKGDTGEKGDTGDTGEKGVKGDTGDDGADGIQGIQGIKGDDGADGATGSTGVATTEEIGRVEVTSNTNTIIVNLSKTKKNLFVKFLLIPTGLMLAQMVLNDDTTSTKAERIHDNHDAILQVVNDNEIQISDANGESSPMAGTIDITNVQNQIKLGAIRKVGANGASSTTVPTFKNSAFKWTNTIVSINKLKFIVTLGTGLYAPGSYVIVHGYD